jgi:hypothetical protein
MIDEKIIFFTGLILIIIIEVWMLLSYKNYDSIIFMCIIFLYFLLNINVALIQILNKLS